MAEHTNIPFDADGAWIQTLEGLTVAICMSGNGQPQVANAAFIARACNAHYALVEALAAIRECGSIREAERLADSALSGFAT